MPPGAAAPITAKAEPAKTPEVTIGATPEAVLTHVPPAGVALSVIVLPTQRPEGPVMAPGTAFTVIVCLVEHPPGVVAIIVSTPCVRPVTRPVPETVAIAGVVWLHDTGDVVVASNVADPAHTV